MKQTNLEDQLKNIRLRKVNKFVDRSTFTKVYDAETLINSAYDNIIVQPGKYNLEGESLDMYGLVVLEPGVEIQGANKSIMVFNNGFMAETREDNLITFKNIKQIELKSYDSTGSRLWCCHLDNTSLKITNLAMAVIINSNISYQGPGPAIEVVQSHILPISNKIHSSQTGIKMIDSDGDIIRNTIYENDIGIDLGHAPSRGERMKLRIKNKFRDNKYNFRSYE